LQREERGGGQRWCSALPEEDASASNAPRAYKNGELERTYHGERCRSLRSTPLPPLWMLCCRGQLPSPIRCQDKKNSYFAVPRINGSPLGRSYAPKTRPRDPKAVRVVIFEQPPHQVSLAWCCWCASNQTVQRVSLPLSGCNGWGSMPGQGKPVLCSNGWRGSYSWSSASGRSSRFAFGPIPHSSSRITTLPDTRRSDLCPRPLHPAGEAVAPPVELEDRRILAHRRERDPPDACGTGQNAEERRQQEARPERHPSHACLQKEVARHPGSVDGDASEGTVWPILTSPHRLLTSAHRRLRAFLVT